MVCFTLIEVFIKKTLYHLICFSYVQKVFIPLLSRLKIMVQLDVFLYADDSLRSLICSLLMTAFFFVGQTTIIAELSWKCLTNMSRRQANKLTMTKRRFFSAPTRRDQYKNPLKLLLGVAAITQYEQYLGLPSFVGKANKQSFSYIRERIWHKMQGWKEKLLSQVGREVLIKAVVQAMPTFTMNCFKLYARI